MFRLKTGKAASRPRFPMGVPHIVFSAKLGDIYAGNTAGIVSARWDIRTRARLPHHSGLPINTLSLWRNRAISHEPVNLKNKGVYKAVWSARQCERSPIEVFHIFSNLGERPAFFFLAESPRNATV